MKAVQLYSFCWNNILKKKLFCKLFAFSTKLLPIAISLPTFWGLFPPLPVLHSTCWAIGSTGIGGEFLSKLSARYILALTECLSMRECTVSQFDCRVIFRDTWTEIFRDNLTLPKSTEKCWPLSRSNAFKSRSSQHFSVDFGSVRLLCKIFVHVLPIFNDIHMHTR